MNRALGRHMESLTRASLAELLSQLSQILKRFDGSPHLSRSQEACLAAAAGALDQAVAEWNGAVRRHAEKHHGNRLPSLQPLPEMSTHAQDCILELLESYRTLKECDLTPVQVQRLTIAAYNLLVVERAVMTAVC